MDSFSRERLLDVDNTPRDKARLHSVALPKSGVWTNSIPSKVLGLHLSNKEFQATAKYRLGLPIFNSNGTCPACGAPKIF